MLQGCLVIEGRAHSDGVQNTQQAVDTVSWQHVLHHRLCPILEKTEQDRTSAGRTVVQHFRAQQRSCFNRFIRRQTVFQCSGGKHICSRDLDAQVEPTVHQQDHRF